MLSRCALVLLVLLALPTVVAAQAQPQPQAQPGDPGGLDQAARALFLSGREAFARGEFEIALTRFRSAYDASPNRHILLYNIATTLDRLRRDEEALAAFERYLELDPSSANRGEIEGRIRSLRTVLDAARARQQQEEQERQAREAAERQAREAEERQNRENANQRDPVRDTTPDEASSGLDPLFVYIAGGVTVAALGLTVWSGLDTSGKNTDYEDRAVPGRISVGEAETLYNDARGAQTRTNVFLGVTAVFAIGTGVLVLLADWSGGSGDDGAEREPAAGGADAARLRARPIVTAGPDGAMVGLSGSF